MKHLSKQTTFGAALLLAAVSSHAQSADKFYVSADAGVALQQDVSIRGGTGFVGPGGKMKFDTGFRAGLDFGYNINDSFAVEFEAGVIRNTITDIGIQHLSDVGGSAELDEVPLLVNGIYTLPLGAFKPYVGVGVGGMAGFFSSSRVPGSFPLGAGQDYNDVDFTFAGQAEVGCKYTLTKNIDLGLVYKFVATTDHSWNDNSIHLKTDGTMTHAIEATFNWRF
jgi:outer membrane protein W